MMPESLGERPHPSRRLVLDSWPVLEWLKAREPSRSRFRELILSAGREEAYLFLSTISQGEIYYNSWREWGEVRAQEVLHSLSLLPVRMVHPAPAGVLAAARIKAVYAGISYADAFAAALAADLEAPVITGDRDFLALQAKGLVEVDWWGK